MLNLKHKIILASKSPRRSHLLQQAGIPFEIRTQDVEEDFPEDMPVAEVAEFLARKKAQEVSKSMAEDEIIITADSTVVLGDAIFNKPADFEDAVRILGHLSGQIHQVYTGVCLWSKAHQKSFTACSNVHMETLSLEEIHYYVEHYKPYDKAGAYAIQEWIGMCKISKIEGTYINIMGLPVDLVYKYLKEWPA